MNTFYPDSNHRLKDLADLVDSAGLLSFVKENLRYMHRYLRGTNRVLPELSRDILNEYFSKFDFMITDKCDHLFGINNYNSYYVKDLRTEGYIGLLHLNDDAFGYLYCFASDMKRLPVSDIYCISPRTMFRDRGVDVDWTRYSLEKTGSGLSAVDSLLSEAQYRTQSKMTHQPDPNITGKEK